MCACFCVMMSCIKWTAAVLLVLWALWPTSPPDTHALFDAKHPFYLSHQPPNDTAWMCNRAAEHCEAHSPIRGEALLYDSVAYEHRLMPAGSNESNLHWYDQNGIPLPPTSYIHPDNVYIPLPRGERWVIPPRPYAVLSLSDDRNISRTSILRQPRVEHFRGVWQQDALELLFRRATDFDLCSRPSNQFPYNYDRRAMRTSYCARMERTPEELGPNMRWIWQHLLGLHWDPSTPLEVERFVGREHFWWHEVGSTEQPVFATVYTLLRRSGPGGKRLCFPLAHTVRPARREAELLVDKRSQRVCGAGSCFKMKPGDMMVVYNVRPNNQTLLEPRAARLFCDLHCTEERAELDHCGRWWVMVQHIQ